MKRTIIALILGLPALSYAQSAVDALQITQPDFKGTARFMSMGGAFTALGGDLTVLGQNPAGIGIYRSSDVGVTLDINFQGTKTSPSFSGFASKQDQTKAYCNNFGYIGATNFDGPLKTFNWGVSYGRVSSFDRIYSGYTVPTHNSLSNYVAAASNGIFADDMLFNGSYNPYKNPDLPWLSILSYSAMLINPTSTDTYVGLMQDGTMGDAQYSVREKGYVDEYNIAFGGNVENIIYWGLDFGITDIDYQRFAYYSESMADARIPVQGDRYADGDAGFELNNRKHISGSGWNMKVGLIFRPINELRVGVAVHTPTWYKLSQGYDAEIDYSYYNPAGAPGRDNPLSGTKYSDIASFDWRLNAPWKLMFGVAGVIGNKAIVSLDYQYDAYGSMKVKRPYYGPYDYVSGFEDDPGVCQDIKNYCQGASTIRLGLEYRVTPQFSLRAGYNYLTSYIKNQAADGNIEIYTSGTDPSYTFDKHAYNITCGLGYRYKSWYIDAAYIYQGRESTYHAFTDYDRLSAPQSKLTDNNSSLVISTGLRF